MIKVLDHGFVRLVSFMQPILHNDISQGREVTDVIPTEWTGDLEIVRNARVSYNADWRTGKDADKDEKLIYHMMRGGHSSPFEAMVFTFEVKAPIFVFRQWHRHRTWCLAGNTQLIFTRPSDGKASPMSIHDLVRKWNPPEAKRERRDRTKSQWNRERLGGMSLRSPTGDVHVRDAWFSGEKVVFALKTPLGIIEASADHRFQTPNGWKTLGENPTEVMAMISAGNPTDRRPLPFTRKELRGERWVEFQDGYEVSNLGRVRSYWKQGGGTQKHKTPKLKATIANNQGRVVVGINGKARQVSHLVWETFHRSRINQILHRDDNPFNNRDTNLYDGSAWDNSQDQYHNGGRIRLRGVPVKVLSVKRKGIVETFDITVDGDHSFVANNLVVHNSYNELSARYQELDEEFYVPDPAVIGQQSKTDKQAREVINNASGGNLEVDMSNAIRDTCQAAFQTYKLLLSTGCPRELARGVLPVNTYSRMFATVDLHNLFHFLRLRLDKHAQWEIQQYAYALCDLIRPIVPISFEAFVKKRIYDGRE